MKLILLMGENIMQMDMLLLSIINPGIEVFWLENFLKIFNNDTFCFSNP